VVDIVSTSQVFVSLFICERKNENKTYSSKQVLVVHSLKEQYWEQQIATLTLFLVWGLEHMEHEPMF